MQSLELLSRFIKPLEQSEIPYFVTGSIASIFYGEPRLTHDIDIVVHLSSESILKMEHLFPLSEFYCPPNEVMEIEARRKPYGHFNLIHSRSGFKADIYTDAGDPLHTWSFEKRKRIELSPELSLWLAPAEYVIIRKLEYYREGGSDKHITDIFKMWPSVQEHIDRAFLRSQLTQRDLEKYWSKVGYKI